MSKVMSPSTESDRMSDGEIDKAADMFRSALRKNRDDFATKPAHEVITTRGFGADLVRVFRSYYERIVSVIARLVKVDRSQTPEQAIAATKRKQYLDADVVKTMPRGTGEEAKVIFFKPDKSAYDENGWISDDNLEKEFALRNLIPADPYSQAAVNQEDPAFADEHPNATHWKDANGKWCYAAFSRWDGGGRRVDVDRNDGGWDDRWWFAGLASPQNSEP